MITILLTIQIFIVLFLIAVILLQKTGTDSLAGLSGGGHGMLSSRTASNVFSKATIGLAIAFMLNSLIIAKFSVLDGNARKSFWETPGELIHQESGAPAVDAKSAHKHEHKHEQKNGKNAEKSMNNNPKTGEIKLPEVPEVIQ